MPSLPTSCWKERTSGRTAARPIVPWAPIGCTRASDASARRCSSGLLRPVGEHHAGGAALGPVSELVGRAQPRVVAPQRPDPAHEPETSAARPPRARRMAALGTARRRWRPGASPGSASGPAGPASPCRTADLARGAPQAVRGRPVLSRRCLTRSGGFGEPVVELRASAGARSSTSVVAHAFGDHPRCGPPRARARRPKRRRGARAAAHAAGRRSGWR